MDATKHIILYGNIIPVKGFKRSILCDLQRESYELIPNALFEILLQSRSKKIEDLFIFAGKENEKVLNEYFEFLLEKDLAFITSEPLSFPELKMEWKSPSQITNAIIDFDEQSNHDMVKVVTELSDLGCIAVEIRMYGKSSLNEIQTILQSFNESRIRSIEVVIVDQNEFSKESLCGLMSSYQRLSSILVTSSQENKSFSFNSEFDNIHYVTQKVDSSACCGQISSRNFSVNVSMVTESLHFNSCLNKKVGIDVFGNIKNCPSSNESFGHLSKDSIRTTVVNESFRKKWFTNKDQIDICKDCEFRYICVDCRVYIENSSNPFSKPRKCTYDPYQAKWMDQSADIEMNA